AGTRTVSGNPPDQKSGGHPAARTAAGLATRAVSFFPETYKIKSSTATAAATYIHRPGSFEQAGSLFIFRHPVPSVFHAPHDRVPILLLHSIIYTIREKGPARFHAANRRVQK